MSIELLLSARLWMAISNGIVITVSLTLISMTLGLALGTALALMRVYGVRSLQILAWIFIFVFRGVPLLIVVYFLYYGLPTIGVIRDGIFWEIFFRDAFMIAALGFTLVNGAYLGEAIRGGISTVKKGEIEAGYAVGMTSWPIHRRIVLPIAFRYSILTIGNEALFTVKATAIASVITVRDLLGEATAVGKLSLDVLTPYVAAALVYFVLVQLLDLVTHLLNRRLNPPEPRKLEVEADARKMDNAANQPVHATPSSTRGILNE